MRTTTVLAALSILVMTSAAFALPAERAWQVYYEDTRQDPLYVPKIVHELGENTAGAIVFPPDEEIVSQEVPWEGHIPCTQNWEPGFGAMVQVEMKNLSPIDWYDVHYVADPETILTNDDGLIGNAVSPYPDATLAFKIDWLGVNTPLVFESMVKDNVFQSGETWQFVIQNYVALGPPTPFNSAGIAGNSAGWPPSTGSIIAIIPEPATAGLLGIVLIALAASRRR